MLCRDCPFRDLCQAPCPSLEKELARLEYYQRELIVSPEKLEYLAETSIQMFGITMVFQPNSPTMRPGLRAGLELLSSQQREAIELYFLDNLTIPEIAERLKINRSSVQRRLRRGLKALREMFG
jgi:predicted DNA-binding protein (UPF0251 family)